MARPEKQRLSEEEAIARKEEAMARKEEARVRAKAERAALQAALHKQQAEHQRRLLQEAATAQRERQATGSGGASSGAAAAAAGNAAARAPLVDADGPIDDLVAMVLAGAAPTLDPSSCLGLPPASGREQARKRYRQLALRLHPDKCDHPSADEAFKRIEEAWRFIEAGADDPV